MAESGREREERVRSETMEALLREASRGHVAFCGSGAGWCLVAGGSDYLRTDMAVAVFALGDAGGEHFPGGHVLGVSVSLRGRPDGYLCRVLLPLGDARAVARSLAEAVERMEGGLPEAVPPR